MTFKIDIEREFAIDRAEMWKLWTDPDHVARWMRPSLTEFEPTLATVDLRQGGAYRFEMVAKSGDVHAAKGVFVELDEPSKLSFTWSWEGQDEEETFVEVLLTDTANGTKVQLLHTKLVSQESADNHAHGWNGCLETLANLY